MGAGESGRNDAAVFGADDEIGRDLARVNWGQTPLGLPAEWPQSLTTAVSILLSSRFSMWMAWGPELTFFCNAAYRRDTLGSKYPWALGRPAREVWAEIWDDIGPRIERVLSTEQATWDAALLLFLETVRISGGVVSHVLLQSAARRRRPGRRLPLCCQRRHRQGDQRAADGDAARSGGRSQCGGLRAADGGVGRRPTQPQSAGSAVHPDLPVRRRRRTPSGGQRNRRRTSGGAGPAGGHRPGDLAGCGRRPRRIGADRSRRRVVPGAADGGLAGAAHSRRSSCRSCSRAARHADSWWLR